MKRVLLVALALVAGAWLSACGGSSGPEIVIVPTATATATPSPSPTATPQPATGEGLLPGFVTTD